jgi:hypothetical protein
LKGQADDQIKGSPKEEDTSPALLLKLKEEVRILCQARRKQFFYNNYFY